MTSLGQDIYQVARLTKIPRLGDKEGNELRIDMERRIKAAEKSVAASHPEEDDEGQESIVSVLARKGMRAQAAGVIRLETVASMRTLLSPPGAQSFMLRRDRTSEDYLGQSLIGLPPLVRVALRVKLSDRENDMMAKILQYNSQS